MSPGSKIGQPVLLSVLQRYLFISLVTLPYSLCVAAGSVNAPTLARREDDLADFGETVPILGRVSNGLNGLAL